MKTAILFLSSLLTAFGNNTSLSTNDHETCIAKILSKPFPAQNLTINITKEVDYVLQEIEQGYNFSSISRKLLTTVDVFAGVILTSTKRPPILALNRNGRVKEFLNRANEVEFFWKVYDSINGGWTPPFRDCIFFRRRWFYAYVSKTSDSGIALFIPLRINHCDERFSELLGATAKCDSTTECIPIYETEDELGGYRCVCRNGYFHQAANRTWRGFLKEDMEDDSKGPFRCSPCPSHCGICETPGICMTKRDPNLRTAILGLQAACMGITVVLGFVVFRQRKSKAIASSMWTVLETILLGIFLLYSTVVIDYFNPSILQCLLLSWARELGFIICYGAIILKLYRHLIEFRTRKAHRWVVKDTDLLKYLLIMVLAVFVYMAAYVAISLNFHHENFDLLYKGVTSDNMNYKACKPLWWDYVTEVGELSILLFGIQLSHACRNAKTQFNERKYLCAAVSIEFTFSSIYYMLRILILSELHPDMVLIINFLRSQFTATPTMLLVFIPKFWYQQKQIRSLGQEYSCRIPVDAFKDINAHGSLTGNNSDVEIGEVSISDMNPDDIRAELKRLYTQLEIYKNKTIRMDNPHISKRRGGRKAPHRKFSLQKKGSREKNLYGYKHRAKKEEESVEPEPSRTPEDSVCSNEGPSTIYNELPSGISQHSDQK